MTSLDIPSDLPLSLYLFKQCKLWVWDFDDTLIDTKTYLNKNMSPDAILNRCDAELDIEVPQWRYFRRLVEFLVMHGRYVGIASFGTYEIIQAYMKRIMGFNQQFFTKKNIIAPQIKHRDTFRFNIPPNKNEYIYTLMRIYRVQDFKRVVLFDDQPSNIADAIAIGIVGIQIASPTNGDLNNNLYFGSWVMDNFDNKIKTTCGDEIYLNKTYTGMVSKENYTGQAYNDDNNNNSDINFGTGVRATDNYFMEPYNLGVNDDVNFKPVAFGTGIGDRKILNQPQFRWNGYKNNIGNNAPKWYNGNYVNIPGNIETTGYWNESDYLGGNSVNFWDTHQSILGSGKQINNNINEIKYNTNNNIQESSQPIEQSNYEAFTNNDTQITNCCKPFTINWIIILFAIILLIMIIFMFIM